GEVVVIVVANSDFLFVGDVIVISRGERAVTQTDHSFHKITRTNFHIGIVITDYRKAEIKITYVSAVTRVYVIFGTPTLIPRGSPEASEEPICAVINISRYRCTTTQIQTAPVIHVGHTNRSRHFCGGNRYYSQRINR